MTTLYDLLGALPGDDAGNLRKAFRKAVKGVHPDIRPNDPEAALNFRLIVRAMELLEDPDQRAAYDHLLDQARRELEEERRAARIRTFAFAMIGLAGVSVVAVSARILFAPMAALPPQERTDELAGKPPEIASNDSSARPGLNGNSASRDAEATKGAETQDDFLSRWGVNDGNAPADRKAEAVQPAPEQHPLGSRPDTSENSAASGRHAEAATVSHEPEAPPVPAPSPSPPARQDDVDGKAVVEPDDKTDPSAAMHARGILAYRSGDLKGALADFDRAIALNPRFMTAYIDRGIVLYRMGKLDRALAEVARARQIDRAGRARSASAFRRKRREHLGRIVGRMGEA